MLLEAFIMLFVVIIVQIMAVFVVGQLTVHFGANTRVEYRVSPNNQKVGILIQFNSSSLIVIYSMLFNNVTTSWLAKVILMLIVILSLNNRRT